MTDHDALLRAIIENPAEDTPRLVFADWLDEHADTFPAAHQRAAFIRDDIAMSQRDEYDPVRLRWELIEKPHREGESWVSEILPATPKGCEFVREPLLRRGFPWGFRIGPDQYVKEADQLCRQIPVEGLEVVGLGSALDDLFGSSCLSRLRRLRVRLLRASITAHSMRLLADSPHATALEELDTEGCDLPAATSAVLFRSALFPRLEVLNLSGTRLGPQAVAAFPRATGVFRLRELLLKETGLSGAHTERLLAGPALGGVVRLDLTSCPLRQAGHEALARGALEDLRALVLNSTSPGAEGFRTLCASLVLSRLALLGYRDNHVNSATVTELTSRPEVSGLRVLDLTSNPIGNAGAAAIARSPHLTGLLVLNLRYCVIGNEGVEALLESPLADGLVLLNLTGSPASAEMKELLKARMGDRVRV